VKSVHMREVVERMSVKAGKVEILIVEDSATQAEKLKYGLEKNNYNVLIATNGREALELINTRKPEIVVTDIVMPVMDGFQLCRTIRADESSRDMPVILLTALSAPEDVLKGLECGADNFIMKPYDEQSLLASIGHALDNKEMRKESKPLSEGEILFRGQKYFVNAERHQILDFMISTYETAIMKNQELRVVQEQLEALNEGLEQKVELRTAALVAEIEERKKAEEQVRMLNEELEHRVKQRTVELEAANGELESFIYSVSHDLRGPLRHISGFVDLLMKNSADKFDKKEKQYLSRIHDGSEKMNRLIDDLLNLSRISRQEIQRTEVNVSEMAASIVTELREAYPGRIVEVDIKEGITAVADHGLIEVILSNLLGNAWKFTAKTEHSHIEFGTVEHDGKIIYYVNDNGAGFDQQYAGKMFWPFHRLHSEAAFEGTGIGLAIVDRIIRLHGGKVWAEGIEGKGATIYFSLS
jgi:two-component system, sensor histidine kinase and response regulator